MLFALVVAHVFVGRRYLGGTLWDRNFLNGRGAGSRRPDRVTMSDGIAGWEVVSEHVNRHGFWEIVIGLFAGLRPPPTITYTVRLKSTGATRTITCFGAGELPERIAKGQFDYEFDHPRR